MSHVTHMNESCYAGRYRLRLTAPLESIIERFRGGVLCPHGVPRHMCSKSECSGGDTLVRYAYARCGLQCVAVCCAASCNLVAVCCSVLLCALRRRRHVGQVRIHICVLQCIAVRYSVLQCVEVCCSLLQCVAVHYCGGKTVATCAYKICAYFMMNKDQHTRTLTRTHAVGVYSRRQGGVDAHLKYTHTLLMCTYIYR